MEREFRRQAWSVTTDKAGEEMLVMSETCHQAGPTMVSCDGNVMLCFVGNIKAINNLELVCYLAGKAGE